MLRLLRNVFGFLDDLEVGIFATLALTTVVLGPLVVAVIAASSGRWFHAALIGLPWCAVLGRAGWELRSGRIGPVTFGLGFVWLVATVVVGNSLT